MSYFRFPDEVNERAARVVAGCVVVLIGLAALTQTAWLLPILAGGFFLRWGFGARFSPLARTATWLAPKVAEVKLVPGPPKRFAQAVGATCLALASVSLYLGFVRVGWAVAAMVLVFAALESSIGFCMGCWVYRWLIRAGLVAPDRCERCAPTQPDSTNP